MCLQSKHCIAPQCSAAGPHGPLAHVARLTSVQSTQLTSKPFEKKSSGSWRDELTPCVVPRQRVDGALIVSGLVPGGPAAPSGMKVLDMLLEVDGQSVRGWDMGQVSEAILVRSTSATLCDAAANLQRATLRSLCRSAKSRGVR